MKLLRWALLSVCLAVAAHAEFSDRPFPAHKIAGNVYYVGSEQLASYLITTPQGHILINTSLEQTVPLIQASVEKLGFRFKDIKIVLISHAHFDHCESLATVKAATGAKIFVMKGDDDVVTTGGKGSVGDNHRWRPVAVDRVLHDGDTVQLSDATLIARLTPGHTKGCTTWTLVARDGARNYNVVIVGSPNVNPGYRLVHHPSYPGIASDFARTFTVLRSLPCDVFLGAHGSYYGLTEKYRLSLTAKTNPFVDPVGYRRFVQEKQIEFQNRLKRQSGA